MEIITGRAKGRRLLCAGGDGVRPSSARSRGGIFSILQGMTGGDFSGYRVLDAFAGSGALGLEAWSEGSDDVVFFERDKRAYDVLLSNIRQLEASAGCHAYLGCSPEDWGRAGGDFSLIFFDPPYAAGLMTRCLEVVCDSGILRAGGVVVAEYEIGRGFAVPPGWKVLKEVRYGRAGILMLSR